MSDTIFQSIVLAILMCGCGAVTAVPRAGVLQRICPPVLCCGTDGITYSDPCRAPYDVTCVSNQECDPQIGTKTEPSVTSRLIIPQLRNWSRVQELLENLPIKEEQSKKSRRIVFPDEERKESGSRVLIPELNDFNRVKELKEQERKQQEYVRNVETKYGHRIMKICHSVICCGSDGRTYYTPCDMPDYVHCVTNTRCEKGVGVPSDVTTRSFGVDLEVNREIEFLNDQRIDEEIGEFEEGWDEPTEEEEEFDYLL